MTEDSYAPIGDYGVIGNLQTCALVCRDGSIDWCCLPDLESPSVFAALLDDDRGGRFSIRPAGPHQSAQSYVPRTNVLRTHFFAPSGTATLTDWMRLPDREHGESPVPAIYRQVTCEEGTVEFAVEFAPRLDYARVVPAVARTERGVVAHHDGSELHLVGPDPFTVGDDGATASTTLGAGETARYTLRWGQAEPFGPGGGDSPAETVRAWRDWVHDCDPSNCLPDGRWHDLLVRSELALKLLIHYETGAIAAAPTTSLPEAVEGTRNWDYRFNWLRDAALTVQALYKLDHLGEARRYFDWLVTHVYEKPSAIRPLYGLHGNAPMAERTLDHLEGYRSSAPVRVGNAAAQQRQLDVFGELVLAIYETSRFGERIDRETWNAVRSIVGYVARVWDEPGAGIWEVRTGPHHFVHSKVMCWTALDRAIRLVEATEFDGPVERWRAVRADIRDAVLERGYSEEIGSFVRSFGSDELDATGLLVPVVGFLPFDDPRVQGTIDAISRRLTTDEGLVYRYRTEDGMAGEEGTFVLCSFWLVNALALSGRVEEAERLFETLLDYASPLGLLAEQVDPTTDDLLGNFPQAFSHLGLINSALYIDRVRENRQPGPDPLGTEPGTGADLTVE